MADETSGIIEKMNEGIRDFNDELNSTDNLLSGIQDSLKSITSWTGGLTISFGLKDMVSSLMKINNEATKSAAILGQGAFGKSLKESTKDISDNILMLQKNLGKSTEEAKKLTDVFLENRITENLNESTAAASMFGDATGATTDAIMSMYNEMYHGAQLSTKSINSMLADMSKVQRQFGLTEKGMSAVNIQAGKMAVNLRGFGATDQQIKNMTVDLTKFASAMEKVGVNAQAAVAWVDKLTNPDNIEDNIGLFAQLGISMEDAMSGNFDAMQSGLQEFSQRIVDMGPIAGGAYARQFNYSYSQAMKTANLESVGDVEQTSEEQALSTLNEMVKTADGMTNKIMKFFNSIKGNIMSLGPAVLAGVALIGAFIRKQLRITDEDVGKIASKAKKNFSVGTSAGAAVSSAGMSGAFNTANKAPGGGADIGLINGLGSIGPSVDFHMQNFTKAYNDNILEEQKVRYQRLSMAEQSYKDQSSYYQKMASEVTGSAKEYFEKMAINASNAANGVNKRMEGMAKHDFGVATMLLEESKKSMNDIAVKQTTNKEARAAANKRSNYLKEVINSNPRTAADKLAQANAIKEYDELQKQLGNLRKESKDLEEAMKGAKGNTEKYSSVQEKNKGFMGALLGSLPGVKGVSGAVSNFKEKREQFQNYKTSVGGWKNVIGRGAGTAVGKTASVALKGTGALLKSMGKLSLVMGAAGIVMKAIQPVIEQIKQPITDMLEVFSGEFGKKITSALGNVMPEIMKAIEDLMPVFDILLETIMNVITPLLKPLLDVVKVLLVNILIPLIKTLLPPLLTVLSFIVRIAQALIYVIGGLIRVFNRELGKSMFDLAGGLGDASKALKDGANSVKENNKTQKETLKFQKEKAEEEAEENKEAAVMKMSVGNMVETGGSTDAQVISKTTQETAKKTQEEYKTQTNKQIEVTTKQFEDLKAQIEDLNSKMLVVTEYVNALKTISPSSVPVTIK